MTARNACQWIEPDCDVLGCLDRGEPYLRCSHPAEPGSSYCAAHRERAVVRRCEWEDCEKKPWAGTRYCRQHHAEHMLRRRNWGSAA